MNTMDSILTRKQEKCLPQTGGSSSPESHVATKSGWEKLQLDPLRGEESPEKQASAFGSDPDGSFGRSQTGSAVQDMASSDDGEGGGGVMMMEVIREG